MNSNAFAVSPEKKTSSPHPEWIAPARENSSEGVSWTPIIVGGIVLLLGAAALYVSSNLQDNLKASVATTTTDPLTQVMIDASNSFTPTPTPIPTPSTSTDPLVGTTVTSTNTTTSVEDNLSGTTVTTPIPSPTSSVPATETVTTTTTETQNTAMRTSTAQEVDPVLLLPAADGPINAATIRTPAKQPE